MNRFCFIACRRQRLLPDGGCADPLAGTGIAERLGTALGLARRFGQISLDPPAASEWHDIYTQLANEPEDKITSALCARAEAHVLRLSMLYALVDGCPQIRTNHLRSGLALWDYAARSAAWAIRSSTGDPLAEHIYTALADSPNGLTRTELRDLFNRNQPAARVDAALVALAHAGRAHRRRHTTAGRPAEVWTVAQPADKLPPAAVSSSGRAHTILNSQ